MNSLKNDSSSNDRAARLSAVDPNHSVIVQAPAGSGKTTLLVERYLGLLSVVNEPEEILAITFTRKAAAEMKQRVLRYLDPNFHSTQPHEQSALSKARAAQAKVGEWKLRENPQRMQIRTIDSFNQYLARNMPVASRLGPVPSPSDNAQRLYRQAARNVLSLIDQPAQADARLVSDITRLLSWRDNQSREIEDLLTQLLGKREQWLRVVGPGGTPEREHLQALITELVEQHLDQAHRQLSDALVQIQSSEQELMELAQHAAQTLIENDKTSNINHCLGFDQLPQASLTNLEAWQGVVELLLVKSNPAFRKTVTISNGFVAKTEQKQRMLDLLEALAEHEPLTNTLAYSLAIVRQLPKPEYSDGDWQILQSLIRVMQHSALELQLVFAERGQSDFAALGEAALRGLGESKLSESSDEITDLGLYLDQRISHLLVDEFQDTNFSQFQLLEKLTAGWSNEDGRSLFLVGDPMQSIYRFREAEVGLFMRARNFGINAVTLTALQLQSNYRSSPIIVDWVNQKLGPVFPTLEDITSGAVAYEPSTAALSNQGKVDILASANRSSEAQMIAEELKQQFASDSPDSTFSAAIIVRSRGHLNEILPALRAAGVQYRAVKLDPLIARPVVQDLLAISHAIMNPADRTALLAILRSPVAGLTLADLDQLAGLDSEQCLNAQTSAEDSDVQPEPQSMAHPFSVGALERLSEDGRQRAEAVFDCLEHAQGLWQRRSLRDLVEGCWYGLFGDAALTEPESDLQDAEAFLGFIETAEREGWLEDKAVFEERLDSEQSGSHTAADESSDASSTLEILTMHSAKGLEWDWVILPGLDRSPRSRNAELLNWLPFTDPQGDERVVLAPLRAATELENPPMVEFIRSEQAARDRLENQRLLYVAATRARTRLTLSACLDSEKETPKPAASSLLAELWPQLESEFLHEFNPDSSSKGSIRSLPDQSLHRIVSGWKASRPSAMSWSNPLTPREHETEIEFNWAGMQARRIGTVIHRLLERVGKLGIEQFKPEHQKRLVQRIPHLLQSLGTSQDELPKSVAIVTSAFEATLADETGRWILSGKHQHAGCELALSGQLKGELVNAIIDRTFIDADECRWIIDYKSGYHSGADLAGFFDEEASRYQEQLGRYAELFRQMGESNVKTALYFPRHQMLKVVS